MIRMAAGVLACVLIWMISPIRAEEPSGLEKLDFREVIAKAKDRVFPAVVYIRCVSENYEGGQKANRESSGSGVIISPRGEVLTNWHVVDKAVDVRCLLSNGEHYDATVIGSDKDTDVALLQLKLPEKKPDLPFALLGQSSLLREGDFVMAMGAPWGLSRSVSIGIISCTRRYLPNTSEYALWLQTDASISPGNSGGPLVNTNGEVIGLNTRGTTQGGDLGFAVPAETVGYVASRLREVGKVDWSWAGLQLQPLKDFDRNVYFDGVEGVMVAETDPDSPARRAGIQPRDRILRINGKTVIGLMEEDLPAIRQMVGMLPKGQPAKFEIVRSDEPVTVELTPREKGKVEGEELACPRWDFSVKTINQFDNPDLFFHRNAGVFVCGVKQPGNAASSGLQETDILLKVDQKEITTLDDVRAVHTHTLAKIDDSNRVVFTVLRNGLMKQVVVDIARDYSRD